MNQNNEPIRDASVLGIPKMLLLGLQHGNSVKLLVLYCGFFVRML